MFPIVTRASLFAGCAGVQAVPVLAGLTLSLVSGGPALYLTTYGEFATWFVVMAAALRAPEQTKLLVHS